MLRQKAEGRVFVLEQRPLNGCCCCCCQLCCEQLSLLAAFVCVFCLCVCPPKISKTTDQNWCNFVGICPIVNARSGWKLVTFDLDLESYFRIFYLPYNVSSTVRSFECLNPATSCLQQKAAMHRYVSLSDTVKLIFWLICLDHENFGRLHFSLFCSLICLVETSG